LADDLPPM